MQYTTPLSTLLAVMLSLGCFIATEGRAQPPIPAPSLEEIANTTVRGLPGLDPIKLVDGLWEGPPAVAGGSSRDTVTLASQFEVIGDMDNDGISDTVAHLTLERGGSGTLNMLAVFSEARGAVVQKAIFPLGDRVQIYDYGLFDNQLTVTLIEAGPSDAMCCPTQMTRKTLRLKNDELVEKNSTALGSLSFETLAGSRWTLHPDNEDQPPEGTTVDIELSKQLISGNAGCNRFKTIVSEGTENAALSAGPVALTRRYCNALLDVWEQRFSELLGTTTRFQFLLGDLLLIGESGRLRFQRA